MTIGYSVFQIGSRYVEHRGLALTTVGRLSVGKGTFFALLAEGKVTIGLLHEADVLAESNRGMGRWTCRKRDNQENPMRCGKIFAVLFGVSRSEPVSVGGETPSMQW